MVFQTNDAVGGHVLFLSCLFLVSSVSTLLDVVWSVVLVVVVFDEVVVASAIFVAVVVVVVVASAVVDVGFVVVVVVVVVFSCCRLPYSKTLRNSHNHLDPNCGEILQLNPYSVAQFSLYSVSILSICHVK